MESLIRVATEGPKWVPELELEEVLSLLKFFSRISCCCELAEEKAPAAGAAVPRLPKPARSLRAKVG